MRRSEGLADWRRRTQNLTERLLRATQSCDAQTLLRNPAPDAWSPAQIVEHMVITNRSYLRTLQGGLERATPSPGDPPLTLSFFGKLICKYAAGPSSNAPAPKFLEPTASPVWADVCAEWQQQQAHILSLLDQAKEINLSRVSVRNPFFALIPMNAADCFEVLAQHTERHVGQIEAHLRQEK